MIPNPTPEEVLAVLDSLEPAMTAAPSGKRLYRWTDVFRALFPRGDARLHMPKSDRREYSPAFRFMLDLELGTAVPGVRGGRSGLWRDQP